MKVFRGAVLRRSHTLCDMIRYWDARLLQESPRQTKPKKGPKRKAHEFRPFFVNSGVFPLESKQESY